MPDKLPLFYFRELLEKAHFRQLSEALWLYLLYADLADPETQKFDCSLTWAARRFGVSRTTIWKWHEKLKEGGYITNVRRGRYNISGKFNMPPATDRFNERCTRCGWAPGEIDPDEWKLNYGRYEKVRNLTKYLVTHHIIPLSWGGEDIPSNRMPLCDRCHAIIHMAINAIEEPREADTIRSVTFNECDWKDKKQRKVAQIKQQLGLL